MQFWETIINTAMIGTDKKQVSAAEVPGGLQEAATCIFENTNTDKEEKFLQLAALTLSYRQCGLLPVQKEINMPFAPAEEKEYCNESAMQVLKDIIGEENIPLLKYWLQHCREKQQVVLPAMVPVLLDTGTTQKHLQLLIADCCGRRGEWLGGFKAVWKFSSPQANDELWQTGTFEQRKEILQQTRKAEPAKAREMVQQTWAQEDANTKAGFLELLATNCGEGDISFLESLSTEKGKKVKEAALQLLKQIPGSRIIQQYQEIVGQSVSIKKEKALLGMVSKSVLQFQLTASLPDSIFQSGIEKLSSQKNITDEHFILYQLISYTPPAFWENHLGCSPPGVIEQFKKTEAGKQMLPALGLAIGRFKETEWAMHLTAMDKNFYPELALMLSKKEREQYLLKFIGIDIEMVVQLALKEETAWGHELAKAIFRHTAKTPYQYNRSFYSQHILLIPVSIIAELEKCTPPEEHLRNAWSNMSEYIVKLVTLKIQLLQAFNS